MKKIRLPKNARVLDLGEITATLEHPAEIEFSREISPGELAELLVAKSRTDLLPMLEHEENGVFVEYSPATGERIETVIAGGEEDLATEEQVRASLEAKTIAELKKLAEELGVEIPAETKLKADIINTIVASLGTKEKFEKISGEESEKGEPVAINREGQIIIAYGGAKTVGERIADGETLASEDETRAHFQNLNAESLTETATLVGIELPDKAKKPEIVELLLSRIGTRENPSKKTSK